MFIVPYYSAIAIGSFGMASVWILFWFVMAAGFGAFYAPGLRFALGIFEYTKFPVESHE